MHVLSEELLSVHQYLCDGPSVHGIFAVVVYFHSRQFLHQFLHHLPFLHLEGLGVVHQGVIAYGHLRHLSFHHSLFHQCAVFLQIYGSQHEVTCLACDVQGSVLFVESHAGELHGVFPWGNVGQGVLPVLCCLCELCQFSFGVDEAHVHSWQTVLQKCIQHTATQLQAGQGVCFLCGGSSLPLSAFLCCGTC